MRVAKSSISSGASSSASASASARMSRPSASVLPTSTESPLRLMSTSPGRIAGAEIAFSTIGITTLRRRSSPSSVTSRARVSAVAAPPMSFFISSIPDAGLMSRPPVSKVTPLPISATFGASSRPQEKSTIRGSSAAARPTTWMSGKLAARSSSPRTIRTRASNCSTSLTACCSSAYGPRMARIDKVASEGDPRRDALEPLPIEAIGSDEPGLRRRIGLEPVIPIERQQEAERGEIGVARRVGEAVDAFGERRRELAGGKWIAHRRALPIDSEQDAGERPAVARKKLDSPGLRLEPAALGERRRGGADRRFDPLPSMGADQPDRRRLGRRGSECVQGLGSPSERTRSEAAPRRGRGAALERRSPWSLGRPREGADPGRGG